MEVSVQQKLLCHLGKGIFRDRCKTKVQGDEMQQNSQNMKITKNITALYYSGSYSNNKSFINLLPQDQ